jgi:hypothetical protein
MVTEILKTNLLYALAKKDDREEEKEADEKDIDDEDVDIEEDDLEEEFGGLSKEDLEEEEEIGLGSEHEEEL